VQVLAAVQAGRWLLGGPRHPWGERGTGAGRVRLRAALYEASKPTRRGTYMHDNPRGGQAGLHEAAGRETSHGLHMLYIWPPYRRTQVG
jgi:hypothetical protein